MKIFQVLILILGLSIFANAQKAILSGTVYDQTGAVIPETKITLMNKDGKEFAAFTNDDGVYTISVASGNYSLEVVNLRHAAWEKFIIQQYELAPVPKMNLDITLRINKEYLKKYGSVLNIEPVKNNKVKGKSNKQ